MKPIRKIAVIGATGRLGAPVTTELTRHFEVRAIVRSPDKARRMLPDTVEIVQADLRDVPSLRAALNGVDALYINLATETADRNLPFYEEREGVRTSEAVEPLVAELCAASPEFRALWQDRTVHTFGHGAKTFHHPVHGPQTFEVSTFAVDGRPDLILIIYGEVS